MITPADEIVIQLLVRELIGDSAPAAYERLLEAGRAQAQDWRRCMT
jgi:hypothetical protein